jgi:hypothetical protein
VVEGAHFANDRSYPRNVPRMPLLYLLSEVIMRSTRKGVGKEVGDLASVGGVMPNRQKNKNPLITTKFGDIVGFAFIKM